MKPKPRPRRPAKPKTPIDFMRRALLEARRALKVDEVPIGAVLVKDGKVIAAGFNRTRTWYDPTAHAEVVVLRRAAEKLRNARLLGCDLYVTKEPCAMCAGALIQARVARVYFGALDAKMGACGSVLTVIPHPALNHRPELHPAVLAEPSVRMLRSFFRARRKKNSILVL